MLNYHIEYRVEVLSLNPMSKQWLTLVGVFFISCLLIGTGFITGRSDMIFIGIALGLFLYLVRNYLK